ncbi:zinc finger protein CONSTANS-LIKE 13-like [Bidens hawaiensis]|uniref:zinc finger protein CONSTANS-LIKE 13-like n=1 Tax=Bidens hawaiensis TaxID=980011 RepID=UPI004048F31B
MPNSPPETTTNHRLCDFCNQSTALLYCRADTAKLCISCDRQVHTTNPLFTKHTRSLLCDRCDNSPASIFCSTHAVVHCPNCDWETHNNNINNDNDIDVDNNVVKSGSPVHDRRPLEGFTGCPSVTDLLAVFGFEDLSKKGLFFGGEDGSGGTGGGFEDCFVWETPGFVSLDDLIVSSGFDHNYQAMGVPPFPKNRNAAFGAYKDELLNQLRELAKSDPSGQEMIKPISEFEFPSEQSFQLQVMSSGLEHKFDENLISSLETNTFQWCPDGSDAVDHEFYSDPLVGRNADGSCIVPDQKTTNLNDSSNINANYEDQSHHDAVESIQVFHGVGLRDINSQEREIALTRYKEKKKSRRYDKHIRYESRKVRAESRTRIRGRFAKMDR